MRQFLERWQWSFALLLQYWKSASEKKERIEANLGQTTTPFTLYFQRSWHKINNTKAKVDLSINKPQNFILESNPRILTIFRISCLSENSIYVLLKIVWHIWNLFYEYYPVSRFRNIPREAQTNPLIFGEKINLIQTRSQPTQLGSIGDAAVNRWVGFSNFEHETAGTIYDKNYSKRRMVNWR